MKPITALPVFILFGTGILCAQQITSPSRVPTASSVSVARDLGCPVDLQAKQGHDGGLVAVRHQGPDDPDIIRKPAQHIHLIVRNRKQTNLVVGATVTARGLSASSRLLGAKSGPGQPDLTRTLDLRFRNETDGSSTAEIDLPAFTSVQSIKLDSITYADGSTWKLADARVCSVAPDGFMLISGR